MGFISTANTNTLEVNLTDYGKSVLLGNAGGGLMEQIVKFGLRDSDVDYRRFTGNSSTETYGPCYNQSLSINPNMVSLSGDCFYNYPDVRGRYGLEVCDMAVLDGPTTDGTTVLFNPTRKGNLWYSLQEDLEPKACFQKGFDVRDLGLNEYGCKCSQFGIYEDDVNNNGSVKPGYPTFIDVAQMYNYVKNPRYFEDDEYKVGDFTGEGEINCDDFCWVVKCYKKGISESGGGLAGEVTVSTKNKFKDRTHFYNNVDLLSHEQILDGFSATVMSTLVDKTNPGLFIIRDADIIISLDESELMGEIETFITAQFQFAEEAQRVVEPETEDIDISDEDMDDIDEVQSEEYMNALEQFAARHARGRQVDFQDLAPYFGYGGSAGMRQYFLKDIQPKIQMMTFTDESGDPSNIGSLMDFNAQMLVDQMLVVINNTLIPKYKKLVSTNKIKQQKVNNKNKVQDVGTKEILGALEEQILPVLETLQQLFNQGDKYTDIAASKDHPAHELLNLVGGYVFREVNMGPITGVYNTMRKDLNDSIADAIISRIGKDKVSRNAIIEKGGIAEYFTGLKTTPDYAAPPASKKGKIVKKLVDIGLTPDVFAEVLVDANESWQDGILDKVQDFDGAIYRDAIEDATDELIDNPKNLEKAILSAIKATKQEEIFQKLEKKAR